MQNAAAKSGESTTLDNVLDIQGPGDTGWLTADEVASLTPESVREQVIALKPLIALHAQEAEELGRPHPEVWEALRKTGYFYHFMPKKYGGCEFGPEDFFLTALHIAEACPSTAWATMFPVEHNWIASLYPETAQDEFFKDGRYIVAPAVSTPPGTATKVEGGYRVTAHWKWGSGVMYANWNIGMVLVEGDEGPETFWMAHPLSQAKVLNTWEVAGLKATGSNDIVVEDIFIPKHMAISARDMQLGSTPGSKVHDHPMYKMPSTSFLGLVTSAPTIGAARGAVEYFKERIKVKKPIGTDVFLSEKTNMQVILGKTDVMVKTAELVLLTLTKSALEMAETDDNLNIATRMSNVAQNAYASRLAREAIRLIIDNSGSSVHLLSDPLQRLARDANVACGHLIQDLESLSEQHGRNLLGLPPITFFF